MKFALQAFQTDQLETHHTSKVPVAASACNKLIQSEENWVGVGIKCALLFRSLLEGNAHILQCDAMCIPRPQTFLEPRRSRLLGGRSSIKNWAGNFCSNSVSWILLCFLMISPTRLTISEESSSRRSHIFTVLISFRLWHLTGTLGQLYRWIMVVSILAVLFFQTKDSQGANLADWGLFLCNSLPDTIKSHTHKEYIKNTQLQVS